MDETNPDYRVLDELKSHLPRHPADELLLLEEALRQRGRVERPFVVARLESDHSGLLPVLLDGFARHDIVERLRSEGLQFPAPEIVVEPGVTTIAAARQWIEANQLAQRNLSDAQRITFLLRNEALMTRLKSEAEQRQIGGTKVGPDLAKGSVVEQIARKAGKGKTSVKKVKSVMNVDAESLKELIRDGNPDGRLFPGRETTRQLLLQPGNSLESLMTSNDEGERISIDEAANIASFLNKKNADKHRLDEARLRIPAYAYNDGEGHKNKIIRGESSEVLSKVAEPFIDFTFTSPPYPLPHDILGYDVYRYVDLPTWIADFRRVMEQTYRLTLDGGRCAIQIDATSDRALDGATKYPMSYIVQKVMYEIGFEFMDEICWAKQNAVGNRFSVGTPLSPLKPNVNRNHEYLMIFYKGTPKKEWRHDGSPISNVTRDEFLHATISTWNYDYKLCRTGEELEHGDVPSFWYVNPAEGRVNGPCPVPMPLKLAELAILTWSWPNDLVFDPYGGNFTTCLAAKRKGRRYLGIDLSEEYCRFGQDLLRNGKSAL